jgi:hypothetical protein
MTHFYLPPHDYLFPSPHRFTTAYINVYWSIRWPVAKPVVNMEHVT